MKRQAIELSMFLGSHTEVTTARSSTPSPFKSPVSSEQVSLS